MQKERRWEETVRLKERVLKQRDHLVRLEREQKQLMDRMTAFQTDTTQLVSPMFLLGFGPKLCFETVIS